MPGIPREYIGLMRDAMKGSSSSSPPNQKPLKRKKRNRSEKKNDEGANIEARDSLGSSQAEPIVIDVESATETEQRSSKIPKLNTIPVIDLSDKEQEQEGLLERQEATPDPKIPGDSNAEITVDDFSENDEDDDDDEDDFDEFEDVDLENVKPRASANVTGDVNINVDGNNAKNEEAKKKRRTKNVISRDERLFRKAYHRNHIAIMAIHGFIRNNWCNNKTIHTSLMKLVNSKIYDQLHPPREVDMPQIRTRRFLDGLRHLLEKWTKYYKVTSNKGIYKHDWYDWYGYDKSKTTFERFAKCITKGRGSRDIGAQGFVALLRAAGVPSRLVFSLQPPDFTSMALKHKPCQNSNDTTNKKTPLSTQEKLLELRKGRMSETLDQQTTQAIASEIELEYPVFWAEAWESSSKTWITIDPIRFKLIENIKYRSKLEPPLSYPYNNLVYVLGYDRKGGVRDITKRYAEKYYSRTRKKRITKDEAEEIWYEDFLEKLSTRGKNRSDGYEDEYFAKKAETEGMPDSIQDFKNHPFYVLEAHLKSNEILYPDEHCGMIRTRGKNTSMKVYKRENVQTLRTPRAWYQRGRVLKTGVRPMKVKQKTAAQMKDDDDDPEERLYAIFQTSIYVPPPVKDGLITKNAFGNIDVYVDSMIPDGAVLMKSEFAAEAAKMIGLDYAPAVVGFKFERRGATPQIDGIVVAEEFKEAIEVVGEQLKVEAIEKQRMDLEIRALKGWALLLAKLRIKQRLNAQHGKVNEDGDDASEDEYSKLEKEYEEYLDNEDNDDDDDDDDESSEGEDTDPEESFYPPGGFIVEGGRGSKPPAGGFVNDGGGNEGEDEGNSGGFIAREEEIPVSGGFIPDGQDGYNSYDEQRKESRSHSHDGVGGGFLVEDSVSEQPSKFADDEDEPYYGDEREIQRLATPTDSNNDFDRGKTDNFRKEEEEDENMDEYEAFFDQLQDQEDNGSDEDEADEDKTQEPLSTEIIASEEVIQNNDELEEVPGIAMEVLNIPPEPKRLVESVEVGTKSEEDEDDLYHTPAKFTESIIKEDKPDEPRIESESESDQEFKEQLRREEELKVSQESAQSLPSGDQDYEFDYDSE